MGALADYYATTASAPTEPVVDDSPGQFRQGLRSGIPGALSQVNALAGLAGEALGADEFAKGRYDAAAAQQAEAQANAPRIGSYTQVGGLRDAYDYVTGTLGQSVPSIVPAVVGGGVGALAGGPVGAVVGATLAQTPMESGDIVQRQQAAGDTRPASERLLDAGAGGLASAGIQSVLPAMIGGKVVGTAARKTLGEALKEGVTHLPGSMALEGATEAGGEAAKQYATDPNAPMDVQALKEAAVGGAAAGGALHGAGVVADVARSAATAPANVVARVSDAVPSMPADPVAKLQEIYDNGKAKAAEYRDTVAAGGDPATLLAKAGLTPDQIRTKLPEIDAERIERAKEWGQDMLAKAGLTPERRAEITQQLSDVANPAAQQALAAMKRGMDVTSEVGEKIAKMATTFADGFKSAEGAKKSEDFSGVDSKIAAEVVPVLQEIHPGFEADPTITSKLAEGVRIAMRVFADGGREAISSTRVAQLIDVFGDRAADVLDKVEGALNSVPKANRESFYSALNELRKQTKDHDKVLGLMERSLAPELQGTKVSELRRELKVLREWVAHASPETEETAFKGEQVLKDMRARYGDKAEAILDALQKEHEKASKPNVVNEEDAKANGLQGVDEKSLGDTIEYGREVKTAGQKPFRTLDLHPDIDPNGDKGQAVQAMARATKENPGRTVRFATASELGDSHPGVQHAAKRMQADMLAAGKSAEEAAALTKRALQHYGMVVADGKAMPGTITRDNVKEAMVGQGKEDTPRSHYDQPTVFKVDGKAYDARALTKMMQGQFNGEGDVSDEKSALHRSARMFFEGVTALSDFLGKPVNPPDATVIDASGLTVGDARKLGFAPDTKADEVMAQRKKALQDDYSKRAEKVSDPARLQELRDELREKLNDLRDNAVAFDPRERTERLDEAGRDLDPLNDSTVTLGNKTQPVHVNSDGSARSGESDGRLSQEQVKAVNKQLDAMAALTKSAAGQAIIKRGREILENLSVLPASVHRTMNSLFAEGRSPSAIGKDINFLHEKYKDRFATQSDAKAGKVSEPSRPVEREVAEPKAELVAATPKTDADLDARIDHMIDLESFDSLDSPAKAMTFLRAAARRLAKLNAIDMSDIDDTEGDALFNARLNLRQFFKSSNDLGMFVSDMADGEVTDADVRKKIAEAVPEVAGILFPKGGKRSVEAIDPNVTLTPAQMAGVRQYVDTVLGPNVKTTLAQFLHAGEYRHVDDAIRISVHALNPMAVAYHESLHAFVAKLMDQGNGRVAQVLRDVAMSAHVQEQLRKFFATQPAVLKQLSDPEEAAAYMYQLWEQNQLTVGPAAKGIFGRIADAIRDILGIWSKDRRAEEIMKYFSGGEFARTGAANPNAVTVALVEAGNNKAIERAKELTRPLMDFAESLASAGGERLRSTGIPALVDLANTMKTTGRAAQDDPGFIRAAREQRTRVMNGFAASMKGQSDTDIADAMKALQTKGVATTSRGRQIVAEVKTLLRSQLKYMRDAGVDLGFTPDPDYFPRKYDAAYISRHQDEFIKVLESHPIANSKGVMGYITTKEAQAITQRIMGNNGADLTYEISRPGNVFLKQRLLRDIPDAVLEPFMSKDMWEVMDSYVSQASRRAEWARRLGDSPEAAGDILKLAKKQGATDKQLALADDFIKASDGTLGDSLSPTARRLFGNVMVYENVRLLPLAIFSSVVDPMGILVRGGTVKDAWSTFVRGVKELPRAWNDTYKTDAQEQMAELLGVVDSSILSHSTSSLYMQGMAGDVAKKVNDTFFRFNFMEGFNRSMRVGATQAAIRFLERNADGKASAHSTRWLAELGLTPADFTGGKVDVHNPKIRAAINQWVDGAVLRPDAVDKPVWMNDPHYMLISHLKQFAYAFQETILKRVVHEARAGNYSPAFALAGYVPVMIAADLLKGVIQGGGDQPQWKKGWGPSDYVASGVERAGLYGAGQFAIDSIKDVRRGNFLPGTLTGPAVEHLAEGVMTATGHEPAGLFVEHSLPAKSLFMGFMDKRHAEPDPVFAE